MSRLTGFYADAAVDGWALWLPSGATDFDASDGVTDVAGLKRDYDHARHAGQPVA